MACDTVGQLTCRDGMRRVSAASAETDVLDCCPYIRDGKAALIVMRANGALVEMANPGYLSPPTAPAEPSLEPPDGAVATSYTYRYVGEDGEPSDPITTQPILPSPGFLGSLDGGFSFSLNQPYRVDAMLLCEGDGKVNEFDAGVGAGVSYVPFLTTDNLCRL